MVRKNSISQLKTGVILSYIITVLNMALGLVYTPVMIKLLGQSEYGLYTLVGSVVSYLSLFSLGFSGAYLRFYSRYASQNDKAGIAKLNGMFLILFLIMGMLAFICGMILSCFTNQIFGSRLTAEELEKAEVLMRFLVVNIALTFPCSVMDSIITSKECFVFQRLVTLAGVICNPFLSMPLLFCGFGSVAIVAVTTGITLLKLFVNIGYCVIKLHVSFSFQQFDFLLLREMSGFSFFLFLNMIIDQVNWSIDKFILGRLAGTTAVAIYGVGAQINSLYVGFSTAISSVFSPRVNRIAAEHKKIMHVEFTELFIRVGRIQALLLLLIVSGFVVFGEYFITDIYSTAEYQDAYIVVLLLILPVTIPLIQNLGIEIQRAINKHRVRAIIYMVMAIENISISIPLAKNWGPIGAAMGTTFSLLFANGLIMNVYYHKAIGLDMPAFWKSIFSLCKGIVIPALFGFFIRKYVIFESIVAFLLWIMVYATVYVVSMWLFGMNDYERNLIRKPVEKIVRKMSRK